MAFLLSIIVGLCVNAQESDKDDFNPKDHATFSTTRDDGRYVSSRAIAHRLMESHSPRLKFNPDMTPTQMSSWREDVAQTMRRLMNFPKINIEELPAPKLIESWQRDGYRIERWESYPLPEAVVPFLVLVPDGVDQTHPAPAILCIPGFGQTKELLAGENDMNLSKSTANDNKNAMARLYAKEGYVAVAVDNPGCGEPGDLERLTNRGAGDYVTLSRALLELGWNYLGYTSYVDSIILDWMKTQPDMKSDRIVISGFSLGTEPLMALGAMDPSIFAFVYNDFLCTTRERALVMTLPDKNGYRPWPNDISHLIPEFLCEFDFPDIVAALAPRPVICTEGGMDRDFNSVKRAFEISGNPNGFEPHHYAMYLDDSSRTYLDEMPAGIDRSTFFKLANVDPPHHYFKSEHVLPWLRHIFAEADTTTK